jgi:uncharacterized protein
MVFKRREQASIWQRTREALYPRKGWRRGIDYYSHRIKRIPDTPHKIAIGFAAGIFVSFTPFFGLHLFLGATLAWLVRGNIVAGIIATFFINPFTLPFVAGASLGIGRAVFGLGANHGEYKKLHEAVWDGFSGMWQVVGSWFGIGEAPWDKLYVFWNELLLPYMVGGLIPGLLVASLSYYLLRPLVAAYQHRRRVRLKEKARQRMQTKQSGADLAT